MPTTKTISHIGDTKFELIKDTHDAFKFTVDDKSASGSPQTVMYIASDASSRTPISSSGRVTMSNTRTTGSTSTASADVDGDVSVGGKILIRGIGGGTATRGAIYAEADPASGSNHRLIIDPYQEDDADPAAGTANNGTVYVRGSLIVEGNKTILDTAETITAENLFGIGATKNSGGTTVGGLATEVGIHVYSGTTSNEHFVYDFSAAKWRTGLGLDTNLKDLEAKNIYAAFTGDLTGNADTSTKLATPRNIGGVSFDGSADIALPGVNTEGNQNTTGNAATATILATSRTIGGVSFDGSADIALPGVNAVGNQNTTGNAGTTTKLATAINIGGVSFDGSADIDLPGVNAVGNQNTTGNAATATKISTITNTNIVQLTDTQTLTNKTLTSPTLNEPTIDKIKVGATPGFGTDGQFLISKGSGAPAEWHTLSLTTTLEDLTDTTISSSVASNDLLRYDGNKWVNSDSIDIKSVNATTIGNIVPVRLTSSGARVSVKTITATTTGVPIHEDILAYYTGKTFASGKCVAALTDGTNSSVAVFSFSICNTSLTLTLDQEVSSLTTAVEIDYDSGGTVDLNVGANVASGTNNIKYCVKVLPIMTSDSITGAY